jgi:hypothetical protein
MDNTNNRTIILTTIIIILVFALCLSVTIGFAYFINNSNLFNEEGNYVNKMFEGMTNIKPYSTNEDNYEIENIDEYDPYDPYNNKNNNQIDDDDEITAKITDKNEDQMECTKVDRTYYDNYGVKFVDKKNLCLSKNLGLKWSNEGNIDDMKCTKIIDPFDPNGWDNDYLCLPNNSPYNLTWSQNGKILNKKNVKWNSDNDDKNYLCINNNPNSNSSFYEF